MKRKIPIEQLLRWRHKRAELEASPAPKAARLLKLAQPWWEKRPEQYRSLVKRLGDLKIAGGHATIDPVHNPGGNPVPALLVRGEEVAENYARVQSFGVQNARLLMRFQMEEASTLMQPAFEATFISDLTTRPLFRAEGTVSGSVKYRVDTNLPAAIARDWEKLKTTDQMPFWLILCSSADG